MLQKMQTEVLFLDPDDVTPAIAVFVKDGFEILGIIDPYGPTVRIKAQITTELNAIHFMHWVWAIIDPFDSADISEAGPVDPQQAA
jgi:hypothetical protein